VIDDAIFQSEGAETRLLLGVGVEPAPWRIEIDHCRIRVGAGAQRHAGIVIEVALPKILRAFSRQYPEVRIEVEIGIGMSLFRMMETQALDLAIGGVCVEQFGGCRLWKEPLVRAFASDIEVPDPLPLAFFPEPCPYREAALRALASTQRQWHIGCTSSSLAVRAIATAGIAVTPLPIHAITPGLRILGKKDKLPSLPQVDYVLETNQDDTRQIVAAFSEYYRRSLSAEGDAHTMPRILRRSQKSSTQLRSSSMNPPNCKRASVV
jgi:DNA-binding transcriptional LysR family regulator